MQSHGVARVCRLLASVAAPGIGRKEKSAAGQRGRALSVARRRQRGAFGIANRTATFAVATFRSAERQPLTSDDVSLPWAGISSAARSRPTDHKGVSAARRSASHHRRGTRGLMRTRQSLGGPRIVESVVVPFAPHD